jgi:hypothetical protein
MPKKRTKKKVTKVSLKDILERGQSNAELHQNDPERRKWHKKYRTPRNRLMHLKGSEYTRPLASDPERDIKYQELAREFVNNGMNKVNAYAAVFGVPLKTANTNASKIFNSTWMKAKIREYLLGTDGEFDDLPKEYLIERLMQMIDNNILDYIADDGTYLNVRELKALPEWAQQQIKRLNIQNETEPVALKDAAGNLVRDEAGEVQYVEVRRQHVTIELYDKQKAMEHLAKVMQWITTNVDVSVNMIGADTMLRAESRIKKLRRDDIEGKAERVTSD